MDNDFVLETGPCPYRGRCDLPSSLAWRSFHPSTNGVSAMVRVTCAGGHSFTGAEDRILRGWWGNGAKA